MSGMRDVVVVTGAASGIGRAVARLAARAGWGVVGVDMNEWDPLDLEQPVVGDVSESRTHAQAVIGARNAGTLRAWVNSAGIDVPTRADSVEEQELKRIL